MTKQSEASTEDKSLVKVDEEKTAEKPSASAEKKPVEKSGGSSGSVAKLAVFLFLVIIVVAGAGGYYFYELFHEQGKQLKNQQRLLGQIQNDLTQASEKIDSNESRHNNVSQQLIELAEKTQRTEQASQNAMEMIGRTQRDWVMAEVDYLLRIANQRLAVARDIHGSIAAMKGADERLGQLGDVRLLKIRKQLAKDIANLSSIHQADVNGISMKLDEMISILNVMPYKTAEAEIKAQLEQQAPEEKTADGNLMESIFDTVKRIGDIKVHKRSIKTASTTGQQLQIEQQLRNHLLSARLAVLSFDQTQFLHDLKQSSDLLNNFYDVADNRVANLLAMLNEYQAINLRPELPELTTAWELLQQQLIRENSTDLETDAEEDAVEEVKQ